jgi:hypothetical protein
MPMQKERVSAAKLNATALRHPKAYINADANMNTYAQRTQHNTLDVDRLPLVEENSHIIPANEMIQMNYKDCNSQDQTEKELYTTDAPLFEKGASKIVPMDINDSSHRRVNFY